MNIYKKGNCIINYCKNNGKNDNISCNKIIKCLSFYYGNTINNKGVMKQE